MLKHLDGSLPIELTGEDVEEVWVRESELGEPILVAEGVVEDVEAVQLPHTVTRQKLVVQTARSHPVQPVMLVLISSMKQWRFYLKRTTPVLNPCLGPGFPSSVSGLIWMYSAKNFL